MKCPECGSNSKRQCNNCGAVFCPVCSAHKLKNSAKCPACGKTSNKSVSGDTPITAKP